MMDRKILDRSVKIIGDDQWDLISGGNALNVFVDDRTITKITGSGLESGNATNNIHIHVTP